MIEYDRILVRYGELSTKGNNRKVFVRRLEKSVRQLLKDMPEVHISAERDRMFITLNGADYAVIMERLHLIFGIQSYSPVIKVERDIEAIKMMAVALFKRHFTEGKTFKVRTKRADKTFPFDTNDVNLMVGDAIFDAYNDDVEVSMRQPDIEITVEIRQEAAYLSSETVMGQGGMPVSSAGKAMLMLSGGIDSPVAGYLAMKRGVEIEAVHFYSPPYTSERAKQKAIDLTQKLTRYTGDIKIHLVPFTKIQETIKQRIPEGYIMTSTRRFMMRITDELRRQHGGLAIVNGESLGQVASQTMMSMLAINDVTSTPIIRPLITMDKNDIIKIAEEIDTFELSIQPFEDCCTIFTPKQPKTQPRLDKVERFESNVDFDTLIAEALANVETVVVSIESNTGADDAFEGLL
ncbi:thiamine biosynthesis protein ThiI [Brochothrix campestris FSL F6-1037]|uniref:Probable tRNA sulfurtransferase n=1 Tax=Brochothrix campestris FSL F6-1037 TaxID=1265861 RepID=W7CWI5_9LIST|nr:thiamine biosynthesis protein ThiI [Brochothrix campestris FSL F6-1037]